jgi:hypothetical protein
MEKNLVKEKKQEITFIDRKKSKPIFQTNYEKLKKFILAKNYKEEKVLFRVLYDKIYRPDLYNFIIKGGQKNLNLARNVFSANEDKYEYSLLKENENLQFDDDEIYSENNYLIKLHKYFALHKLTIYFSVPLGCASVYYKLGNKQPTKFNICLALCSVVFLVSYWNYKRKDEFYKTEFQRILERANESQMNIYKKFYFD